MCHQGGPENEGCVVFYLLTRAGLGSSVPLHLGLFVRRGQTPVAQPGAHLSAASGGLF